MLGIQKLWFMLNFAQRRMATEDDFRGAIAYLASDLSKYVTGYNLAVDGGLNSGVYCLDSGVL